MNQDQINSVLITGGVILLVIALMSFSSSSSYNVAESIYSNLLGASSLISAAILFSQVKPTESESTYIIEESEIDKQVPK